MSILLLFHIALLGIAKFDWDIYYSSKALWHPPVKNGSICLFIFLDNVANDNTTFKFNYFLSFDFEQKATSTLFRRFSYFKKSFLHWLAQATVCITDVCISFFQVTICLARGRRTNNHGSIFNNFVLFSTVCFGNHFLQQHFSQNKPFPFSKNFYKLFFFLKKLSFSEDFYKSYQKKRSII